MSKYHHAAHTLDPNVEIPDTDEVMPSAGHDEPMTEEVKEASDEFREQAKADVEAQAERDAEWAERDPKPKPSELLAESGREPAPADGTSTNPTDEQDTPQPESGGASQPPDGTVQDVLDWVGDDKDRAQYALDAERAGQNRATLVAELEKRAA